MAIFGIKLHIFGQAAFYTGPESIRLDDRVMVMEDERLICGQVKMGPISSSSLKEEELPSILRLATMADLAEQAENARLEQEAWDFCRDCIAKRELEMKLVDIEIFFDRSKIIFFFTAPTRIDFRELVKDLVRRYHTRIELRQIGVRHETQMIGTIGSCGMVCCCRRYLRKFAPVTIRMAKEQNLFLNPSKISGSCGRLLCCLSYEQETYDDFFHHSPRIGKLYHTKQGDLRVVWTNMFHNTVCVADVSNRENVVTLECWYGLNPIRADGGSDELDEREDIDGPDVDLVLEEAYPGDPLETLTLRDSIGENRKYLRNLHSQNFNRPQIPPKQEVVPKQTEQFLSPSVEQENVAFIEEQQFNLIYTETKSVEGKEEVEVKEESCKRSKTREHARRHDGSGNKKVQNKKSKKKKHR